MMQGINVEYVDHMGDDSSISNSARVSFSKWKEGFDSADAKLIGYLASHRHTTPFRHNQIQIRCKAPIFLARQLGKHQSGFSWNEVSRRYVKSDPEFFIPEVWRAAPEGSIKQGSGEALNVEGLSEMYEDFVGAAEEIYKGFLKAGVAPEMARMILPQSMLTEWIWSGNLLAYAHLYKERIDSHAQLEAQEFAKQLDKVIRPLFPIAWSALVDIE